VFCGGGGSDGGLFDLANSALENNVHQSLLAMANGLQHITHLRRRGATKVQNCPRPLELQREHGTPTAAQSQRTFRSWQGTQALGFLAGWSRLIVRKGVSRGSSVVKHHEYCNG
jgi:hypothetical protein